MTIDDPYTETNEAEAAETPILRPYQTAAFDDLRRSYSANHRALCLSRPPRQERECYSWSRHASGTKTLIVAHRRELRQPARATYDRIKR
jgi:hypothetical protein